MRSLSLLALIGSSLLLSACGQGGADQDAGAEIRQMIAASTKTHDPAACLRYSTRKALEQSTKLRGEAAVRSCEESAVEQLGELPRRVEVSRIEVDGEDATANVAFEGGSFDGQTVSLALVEVDGDWKTDEILGFVELDREALVLQWGRELLERASSLREVDVFSCIVGELDGLSDEALEALVLDPSPQPIIDLTIACESPSASA